jgi:hypothetical protein
MHGRSAARLAADVLMQRESAVAAWFNNPSLASVKLRFLFSAGSPAHTLPVASGFLI